MLFENGENQSTDGERVHNGTYVRATASTPTVWGHEHVESSKINIVRTVGYIRAKARQKNRRCRKFDQKVTSELQERSCPGTTE